MSVWKAASAFAAALSTLGCGRHEVVPVKDVEHLNQRSWTIRRPPAAPAPLVPAAHSASPPEQQAAPQATVPRQR